MAWTPRAGTVVGKVGPKGQVVIPKDVRDRMGLEPGGSVFLDFREAEGVLVMAMAWNDPIRDALDRFARYPARPGMDGKSASEILHELDREDEALPEAQEERWSRTSTSSTPSRSSGRSGRKPSAPTSKRSSTGRRGESSSSG